MVRCKKHRPKITALHSHHRAPKGDCANCIYFSKQNCGTHAVFGDFPA